MISVAPPKDLHGEILRYETLIATAGDADVAEYRRRAAEVSGGQLATIIYTSGTTGEPKGVMLNHANLSSNSIDSLKEYVFYPDDVALEFLPLAHVYERTVGYGYLSRGRFDRLRGADRNRGASVAGSASDHDRRGAAVFREDLREHSGEGPSRDRA